MALMRYRGSELGSPVRSMFDLLDNFFSTRSNTGRIGGSIDIYREDGSVNIECAAPGFDRDELSVEVERGHISIRGERHIEEETSEAREKEYVYRERQEGFERVIPAPDGISSDDVKARYEDGVLTLTYPEKNQSEEEVKRIEIQ